METLNQGQGRVSYPRRADVLRLAVLGDRGVGKSAFITCVAFGLYDPYLRSTLKMDFMSREILVEQEKVVVQLWEKEISSYHALIVLYDVTSRSSYTSALKIVEEARINQDDSLPILFLGNKMDIHQKRQVMAYEGEVAAIHYQVLFSEISCTETVNTRQSITELIESMISGRVFMS
ncbi:ras-related protein Rab-6-like [Hydractinia symbiolongicarpus]|uniref:ras-related protein Rab-6-like n=1 Tax=Hydractinia symbiolongicarpus TaxID=13093 RepID=UPI00254B3A04|nr:ras-related protein Rab-6-like [Hydractinia symbiolongicarpus]